MPPARDPIARMRRLNAEKAAVYYSANMTIIDEAGAQIREGLYKAYRAAIEQAIAMGGQIGENMEALDDSKAREQMFQRLGRNAQRSMLSAYDQLVTRREGPASHTHYRQGQGRLSGGILRRALASSQFFEATSDGLLFGDTEYLDTAAAHWHRINFGAGPRGEGTDAEYPVRFGATATALGIEEGPSPGFAVPPGIWLSPAGKVVRPGQHARGADQFFPEHFASSGPEGYANSKLMGTIRRSKIRARPQALRPSQGIEAANFMNAGIRRLAEDIPEAYAEYTQDILDGAIKKITGGRNRIEIVQGPVNGSGRRRFALSNGGSLYRADLP